jgi:hypothetical protein
MKVFVPVLLVALSAALAPAAQPVGQAFSLQGTVSARAPSAPVRPLAIKGEVFMQDAIRTATDSKMQVLFADDTVFSQGPNMEVVIDEFIYDPVNTKNNAFKARVERGVFRTVSGKINDLNPEQFEIKTGRATIGIRGCGVSARMDDRRDEISIDFVRTGRVVVVTPLGGKPVEFREPGLLVIEDGGRVRKQRFDPARFVMNLGDTTPNDTGLRGGPGLPPGGGFKREADLIQEELVTLGPAPKPPPPPPVHHNAGPPPPAPWPVIAGSFDGFVMSQWNSLLNVNPLDAGGQDPLHAAVNFNMTVDTEQPNPVQPGGSLYQIPLSVMIVPGFPIPVIGTTDPGGTVTGTRLTADRFQALMSGADYELTLLIERGGPASDWYKAWWGMDKDTPARMRDNDGRIWAPSQGFAVLGNTFTAAETAALKSGGTAFHLVQDGPGWAAGLGHFQWSDLIGGGSESQTFVLKGAPGGTDVRIGGGQDTWSTRLQLQNSGGSPVQADVAVGGTLLNGSSGFNAAITPTVNTLTMNGHNFQAASPQAYGTARLVGNKQPGNPPTGLIGSVTLSGNVYNTIDAGSYQMNLHFGTDLKRKVTP